MSPRVGFSYTYNRDKDNGQRHEPEPGRPLLSQHDGRDPRRHRRIPRPAAAGHSRRRVGGDRACRAARRCSRASARGAARRLVALHRGSGAIPTAVRRRQRRARRACAVGDADRSGYDVPRSWRASLDWNTSFTSWLIRVGGARVVRPVAAGHGRRELRRRRRSSTLAERRQSSGVRVRRVDRSGERRGVGRGSRDARRSSDAWPTRVSDLRGYGGQLTLGLSPDVFKFRGRSSRSTVGQLHAAVDAATVPRLRRRRLRRSARRRVGAGPERCAPRRRAHRRLLARDKIGTVTLFARTQSGLPFTPIVQGDVNGDGRGGDRAFIPESVAARAMPLLAAQLRALLANGSSTRAALPGRIPRHGRGAQRLPRSVDAVAQHAVASADAAAVGRPRDAERVSAERARRRRPGRCTAATIFAAGARRRRPIRCCSCRAASTRPRSASATT